MAADNPQSKVYKVEDGVFHITGPTVVPLDDGAEGRYVRKIIKKRLTVKQYLIVARGAAGKAARAQGQKFWTQFKMRDRMLGS